MSFGLIISVSLKDALFQDKAVLYRFDDAKLKEYIHQDQAKQDSDQKQGQKGGTQESSGVDPALLLSNRESSSNLVDDPVSRSESSGKLDDLPSSSPITPSPLERPPTG